LLAYNSRIELRCTLNGPRRIERYQLGRESEVTEETEREYGPCQRTPAKSVRRSRVCSKTRHRFCKALYNEQR